MQFNNKTGFNRRRKLLELQNLGENRLTTRDVLFILKSFVINTNKYFFMGARSMLATEVEDGFGW